MESVLIVEDSRSFRMLAEQQLKKAGFAPVTCTCLAETRDVLAHNTPFLCAILDYNLPDAHHGEFIDLCLSAELKVGVLTPSQAASLSRLLHMADKALYQAKMSGRNQMVVDQS
ncbi:hypothetical protein [Salinivibrio kushneri]|uniref:hypothetical protein n=1 Tax=Salinivibrio kushneri TaxID=1908198 RepID=UPI0022B3B577|nr:hypothetical protein [Salinivibrio kushneri]WBA17292.1 hypothetical protein O4598_09135 [Salinivibrio kushneri]